MLPQTISHYRLVELIGEGGSARVYRAEHLLLGTTVAIKAIKGSSLQSSFERARLMHEARALATIDHPNIVTLFDAIDEAGELYLVEQYVAGQTLRRKLKDGPLELRDAVGIAIEVAEGLRAVHAHGVVHRDLKPENIMVTADGRCKVLDFGIAHLIGGTTISPDGQIVGTYCYMAPEQMQARAVDARTDLYALGVVLFEMVSGTPPALVLPPPHARAAPGLALVAPHVPPDVRAIVDRLLAHDPDHRYRDAELLLRDLRIVLQRLSPAAPSVEGVTSAERRRRLAARIRGSGFAVTALGVVLLAVQHHRPTPVRVLVAPFENTRADPQWEWLSTGFMDGLMGALGAADHCEVVSRATVMSALQALPPRTAIVGGSLAGAAEDVGVAYLVTGSYVESAAIMHVQCQVHAIERGVLVGTAVQDMRDVESELFPCIDNLAANVVRALGTSTRPGPGASAGAGTRSVDALRHYEEALRAYGSLDLPATLASLKRCVAADSAFVRAHLLMASAAPEAADRRRALTLAMKYRHGAGPPLKDLVEAEFYREEGALDEAATRYAGVLARYPEAVEARAALADIDMKRRRWPEAIAEFSALLQRNPFDMSFTPSLSLCYLQVGRPQLALDLCGRWRARFPAQPMPIMWEIQMQTMLGRYERALALCDTLEQLHPSMALQVRAPILRSLGRMCEAQQVLEAAATAPGSPFSRSRPLALLAYLDVVRGQPLAGRAPSEEALRLQNDWYNRWVAGVVATAAGDSATGAAHAQAMAELLESSATDSLSAEALTGKAYLYDLRGDLARLEHDLPSAARWHRRALEYCTSVDEPLMRTGLGEILLTTGDATGAITEADRALAINPSQPEALLLLGQSRLAQGDKVKARLPLEKLRALWGRADADYVRNVELARLLDQAH